MAITGRTATVAESASATSVTGTRPTDRQAGDYVVAHFSMSCTAVQFTGPGGSWTQLVAPTANAASEIVAVYGMFDPPSDPVGTSSAVAGRQTCLMQAYGGVDTATPIDVSAATPTSGTLPVTIPQVTTVTDGARLVSGVTGDFSTGTWTQPAGMTLVKTHTSGTGRGAAIADEDRPTAGATGSRQWTASVLQAAVGYLFALRPAAPAAGSPTPQLPPDLLIELVARNQAMWQDAAVAESAVALADTAAGDDTLAVTADTAVGDAGAAADTATITVTVPITDTGTGADTIATAATVSVTDVGSGSDLGGANAAVPIGDAGAGADLATAGVPIGVTDTGLGADSLALTSIAVPVADTGSGSDLGRANAVLPITDTGTTADTVGVAVAIGVADTGSGSDAAAVARAVNITDTGAAADSVSHQQQSSSQINLADTGTAADRLHIVLRRPDTGTTARPFTGTTARPNTGTTARPFTGTTPRPNTGTTPY